MQIPEYNVEKIDQFQLPDAEQTFLSSINFDIPIQKIFTRAEEQTHFCALHFLKYKISTSDPQISQSKWVPLYLKVRDRIVTANIKLMNRGMYFHWKRFTDPDELLSDASMTLLRCVEMFDPWKGCKFSTYFINSVNRSLYHKHDNAVNMEQDALRDISGLTEQVDKSGAEKEAYFLDEIKNIWSGQVAFLSQNEHYILCHRHGLEGCPENTLQEIGNVLGICAERVRQIERQAHQKIKSLLERRLTC